MEKLSDDWTVLEAAHLLNRAGFGGTPQDIQEFHQRGRYGAVEWLLAADESVEFDQPHWLGSAKESALELIGFRKNNPGLSRDELREKRQKFTAQLNKERRTQSLSLLHWWVTRMAQTDAPLQEKMVMFWHDHFPTSNRKVRRPDWMFQQNELFRTHALGSFAELIHEVAVDPAMMIYLDSASSKKDKPNENFARELMELFTLGEGNYTEEDVKEAARAFTGYQLRKLTGVVEHQERGWDEGSKEILGQKGSFKGKDVVDLVLKKEVCGQYLAKKIWEYFVYENPSEEIVAHLGRGFQRANYEVKPLLKEIFLSKEFYSDAAIHTRVKSPVEYVVMLSKQLETKILPERALFRVLEQLGQVPFLPPNVAGWDWGKSWVNTSTLLTRYHLAGVMTGAGGDLSEVAERKGGARLLQAAVMRQLQKPDYEKLAPREVRNELGSLVDELGFRLFQKPLRDKDREAFIGYAKTLKGVRFTNSEVAELMHLMMSTPNYQLA